MNYQQKKFVVESLQTFNSLLDPVPDFTCQIMIKIHNMLLACIQTFNPTMKIDVPFTKFLEGHGGLVWDLQLMPPKPVVMGLFARLQFLPSHFMTTFEETFLTGYFESQSQIFGPNPSELQTRYVAYQRQESITPLPQIIADMEEKQRLKQYQDALHHIRTKAPRN